MDVALEAIAERVLGVPTLEARMSDHLDFHEVGVWQVREALEAARALGRAEGRADALAEVPPDITAALGLE